MKGKKPDRRVTRTQQLLQEALLALIVEKGYEGVTVQDILDRANLGRSTFYTHYRDKDSLLLAGFDHLRGMLDERHRSLLSAKAAGRDRGFNLTLELFQHGQENHRLYKAMVGKRSGQMVMAKAHKTLSDLMSTHFSSLFKAGKKTPVPVEVAIRWIASSFLSLLTWWLDNDMPYPPEEMDRIFRTLTLPGVEAGLGLKVP